MIFNKIHVNGRKTTREEDKTMKKRIEADHQKERIKENWSEIWKRRIQSNQRV
jgi:hypothetical protein